MLVVVERVVNGLRRARTDGDFVRIIGEVAQHFGFRSAYIFQYPSEFGGAERVIDTDERRRAWWPGYLRSTLRSEAEEVRRALDPAPIRRFDANNHPPGRAEMRAALAAYDLAELTHIPITEAGRAMGSAGFCGAPPLDAEGELALQVIAYAVFAAVRTIEVPPIRGVSLTPREREVITLSAEGLTSQQIAERLGMSPRTANQHVDNVADKLGTRNRAHTIAEAIRNNLLN